MLSPRYFTPFLFIRRIRCWRPVGIAHEPDPMMFCRRMPRARRLTTPHHASFAVVALRDRILLTHFSHLQLKDRNGSR